MMETQHWIAVVGALWAVITSLAGFVYRELRAQIDDRDKRIVALETAASETVRAKDEEIKEWRRYANSLVPPGVTR
jgi:hypothetical protein